MSNEATFKKHNSKKIREILIKEKADVQVKIPKTNDPALIYGKN